MKERDPALARALEAAGGPKALAIALNITPAAVSNWHQAPPGRVLAIEAATGGKVTRHELRPDIYGAA